MKMMKPRRFIEYFICCIENTLSILNYAKSWTYNIDDRIVSLFEKMNSIHKEYFSLPHILCTYDSILSAEIKTLDLVKNNFGKEKEIFAKMEVLTDTECIVTDLQFLFKSISKRWSLMKMYLTEVTENNFTSPSNFYVYIDELCFFMSTTIFRYLRSSKRLQDEGNNKKNAFLMLCDEYNAKEEEYQTLMLQHQKLEDIRQKLAIIKKNIKKETNANPKQYEELKKLLKENEDLYLITKENFDGFSQTDDMEYLMFLFEDLNEKLFLLFKYGEDIYKIIMKFHPFGLLKDFSDVLEQKLAIKTFISP